MLPTNIDSIDNLGELSFLIKQTNISFKRNAGEKIVTSLNISLSLQKHFD